MVEISHDALRPSDESAGLSVNVSGVLLLACKLCERFVLRGTCQSIKVFFNTEHEVEVAKSVLNEVVPDGMQAVIRLASLDEGEFEHTDDFAVLAAPSNTDGNPARIEKVECIHYENWRRQRPVLMLNPDLVVLTLYGLREHRRPSFLSDYRHAFVLDDRAFAREGLIGALLFAYPRTWEVYLRHESRGETVFRFAKQYFSRPSALEIDGDLSWRLGANHMFGGAVSKDMVAAQPCSQPLGHTLPMSEVDGVLLD